MLIMSFLEINIYRILEKAPEAKAMFSFLKDSDGVPKDNLDLEAHCEKVFELVSTTIQHKIINYM